MTEPPETPEEGGGEEGTDWAALERNAARDFVADSTPDMQDAIDAARAEMGDEAFDKAVSEVLRRVHERDADERLDVFDDDELLDVIGRGGEGAAGELGDMLSSWRDDVDSEPVPPIAERTQEIHDFNQAVDRATDPPRPTEGTPSPMSAQDEATRLRQLATDTTIAGMLQGAVDQLESLLGQVQAALGPQHSQLNAALGPIQEAISAVNGAAVTAGHALGNLESIAGQIG